MSTGTRHTSRFRLANTRYAHTERTTEEADENRHGRTTVPRATSVKAWTHGRSHTFEKTVPFTEHEPHVIHVNFLDISQIMDEELVLSLLRDVFGDDVPDWVEQEIPTRRTQEEDPLKNQQKWCKEGHCCVFNWNYSRSFKLHHHHRYPCAHVCGDECKSNEIELKSTAVTTPTYLKFASRLKWKKCMLRARESPKE